LAVERASTEEEVLVVPISAITATADGRTVVVRISADGREVRVPVTPGASGEGFVAVTVTEGHLDSGDRVVVGR
jgi:multidrug efflux pump subunit AcrA (membrane-fusion protein)